MFGYSSKLEDSGIPLASSEQHRPNDIENVKMAGCGCHGLVMSSTTTEPLKAV